MGTKKTEEKRAAKVSISDLAQYLRPSPR